MHAIKIGDLEIGSIPRVIGTIATLSTFQNRDFCEPNVSCDIAEARLDKIDLESPWLDHCKAIENAGIPVLVTLRLADEGGDWLKPDQQRQEYFKTALEHLSAVDVEAQSSIKGDVCAFAAEKKKPVVVSYHNFQETPDPDQIEEILHDIRQSPGHVIPKIATMVQREADVQNLCHLLSTQQTDKPLCLLGMGSLGRKTRVILPCLGSSFTYGNLDELTAPGQISGTMLVTMLRLLLPEYEEAFKQKHGDEAI